MIFEGEYLNGKRNGEGKEYDKDGRLIFEGEYLLNRKWNGKSYDNKGNILYELIDGNGKVREFNKMYYEGDYFHGEKSGEGILYYIPEIIRFEGKFFNGKKNGFGIEYDNDEDVIYEGEYLNGEWWNGKEIGEYEYDNNYLLNGKYL